MKLKPIPSNTVVHTPTEAEARELLAILHENGYLWSTGEDLSVASHIAGKEAIGINLYNEEKGTIISFLHIETAQREHFPILTLAEFKERYVDFDDTFTDDCKSTAKVEEKPHPKFKVGDKVKIVNDCGCNSYGLIGMVELVEPRLVVVACSRGRLYCVPKWLEPYTEPETTPTEDMEAEEHRNLSQEVANCDKSEGKELNLCELLAGHKTEYFYSPLYGRMSYTSERDRLLYFESLQGEVITLFPNGHSQFTVEGYCGIYPSRTLYEQHPLDPYTAWMKWKEEQQLRTLRITLTAPDLERNYAEVDFRTPSDRDMCIEEIKAIIDKYSKK
ncbi:MAG: hypothetical protein NC418_06265 [Muribaculaceae bacterium]|nr:hypothetical protein [Muribaculaceae bacterium]